MAAVHADSECVTFTGDGARASYGQVADADRRLARALQRLGVGPGDPVGTFMWNDQEHLEAYFAVPCMGCCTHQHPPGTRALVFVANHAKIASSSSIRRSPPCSRRWPLSCRPSRRGSSSATAASAPPTRPARPRYHDLLAAEEAGFAPPRGSPPPACATRAAPRATRRASCTRTARRTCTPRGVHAERPGARAARPGPGDRPAVPRQRLGSPYAAFLSALRLMPGATSRPSRSPGSSPPSGRRCRPRCRRCGPTSTATATTTISTCRPCASSSAAAPPCASLMERFQERDGLRLIQGWGMTEMSGRCGRSPRPTPRRGASRRWTGAPRRAASSRASSSASSATTVRSSLGRQRRRGDRGPRAVDHRRTGRTRRPRSSTTGGCARATSAPSRRTATCRSPTGPRTSSSQGGEWISSVELENAHGPPRRRGPRHRHPDPVGRTAAGVRRRRRRDRPDRARQFLTGYVAKWQVPENWAFVDVIPKTSVGKFDKKALRTQHEEGDLAPRRV